MGAGEGCGGRGVSPHDSVGQSLRPLPPEGRPSASGFRGGGRGPSGQTSPHAPVHAHSGPIGSEYAGVDASTNRDFWSDSADTAGQFPDESRAFQARPADDWFARRPAVKRSVRRRRSATGHDRRRGYSPVTKRTRVHARVVRCSCVGFFGVAQTQGRVEQRVVVWTRVERTASVPVDWTHSGVACRSGAASARGGPGKIRASDGIDVWSWSLSWSEVRNVLDVQQHTGQELVKLPRVNSRRVHSVVGLKWSGGYSGNWSHVVELVWVGKPSDVLVLQFLLVNFTGHGMSAAWQRRRSRRWTRRRGRTVWCRRTNRS